MYHSYVILFFTILKLYAATRSVSKRVLRRRVFIYHLDSKNETHNGARDITDDRVASLLVKSGQLAGRLTIVCDKEMPRCLSALQKNFWVLTLLFCSNNTKYFFRHAHTFKSEQGNLLLLGN